MGKITLFALVQTGELLSLVESPVFESHAPPGKNWAPCKPLMEHERTKTLLANMLLARAAGQQIDVEGMSVYVKDANGLIDLVNTI